MWFLVNEKCCYRWYSCFTAWYTQIVTRGSIDTSVDFSRKINIALNYVTIADGLVFTQQVKGVQRKGSNAEIADNGTISR